MGEHVALVLRVLAVEEKYTSDKEEVYVVVHGVDTEGAMVTNLRLWRFDRNDIISNKTYIIRGLKVVPARQWDEELWKYVPRMDGRKELECVARAAVEDVSRVTDITASFD